MPAPTNDAMKWAAEQIEVAVFNSPPALNKDGTFKTLRQLLNESRPQKPQSE